MKEYLDHIPYYLLFNAIGIVLNFINVQERLKNNHERFTIKRMIKELFGMLWISLAVLGILDYYTVLPPFLISILASFAGYFHSKFIDFIGNDLLIFLGKLLKKWLYKLVLGEEPKEEKEDREIEEEDIKNIEVITEKELDRNDN